MSDGYTPPSASDMLTQAMGLRTQALKGYTPSPGVTDLVGENLANQYAGGYGSGEQGSSVQAKAQAQGVADAYDQDQQQYLSDLFKGGQAAYGTQAAQAASEMQKSNEPWDIAGTVAGAALPIIGGALGGPAGMAAGGMGSSLIQQLLGMLQ